MVKGTTRRRTASAIALLLLTVGGVVVLLARGGSRVEPPVGGPAPKGADPVAGEALREDGRPPAAPDATLAGRGSATGTTEPAEGVRQPAPTRPPTAAASAADTALPTRVVFVDSITGRDVPGVQWTSLTPRRLADPEVQRESVDPLAAGSTPAPAPAPTAYRSGDLVPLAAPWQGIGTYPLEGWVFLGAKVIPSRRMPRAREGLLTVLLHPEADVRIEILGPDGRVAQGARVTEAFVAGETVRPLREERAPDGTRRLRGIPFFAGEVLQLMPLWPGPDAPGGLEPPPEPAEGERAMFAMWRGPMPERPDVTIRAVLRLDGPIGPGDHNETDNDMEMVDAGIGAPAPDPSLLGTVRLRLIDRDGKPAASVRVALRGIEGTTDQDGRVTLEHVHQGTFPFIVQEAGWTFPTTPVTVVGRQVTEIVAREIVGGDVEIVVRDTDGNPVPFAALEVGRADGHVWYDVDDAGIQRLDPYVDVRGRRVLTHQPPGTLRVRASLGTRQGVGEVEVVDRGRRVLRITVTK